MKKLLFLIVLSNNLFAQVTLLYTEVTKYPNRDSIFTITKFITKADSLSSKYKAKGMSGVHMEFINNRSLKLKYSKDGELVLFLETFEDSIYKQLTINKKDSFFLFYKYNGYSGNQHYNEFYYPKENTIEYWNYNPNKFDDLKKVLQIITYKDKKIEKESIIVNFISKTTESHYNLINNKWILEKVKTYQEE